jgi:hemoglobin
MSEVLSHRCPGRIDEDWKRRRSEFPDAPMPGPETFAALGEARIRRIVDRQHRELWAGPSGRLFAPDEAGLERVIAHTADYFVEMFGGPAGYTPARGKPMLRVRHRPLGVTADDRLYWLRAFARAMAAEAVPAATAADIWAWVEPLSMRMIQPLPEPEGLSRPTLAEMGFRPQEVRA